MKKVVKEIAYQLLNMATFGKGVSKRIGNFKIKLPTRYFRYFPNDYEKENLDIVNEFVKENMVVFDIGAHIGFVSAIIAKKLNSSGIIYSFEPTPSTFQILKKTIQINKLEKYICPVQAALSSENGKTTFYISDNNVDNSNSLVNNKRTDREETTVEVTLYSLDSFIRQRNISRIDFLKIDVEGAELQVLRGADKSISKFHPLIILALHPKSVNNFGDSLEAIWDFVIDRGYKVEFQGTKMDRKDFVEMDELFDVFLRV